jgi:hypothetical protein
MLLHATFQKVNVFLPLLVSFFTLFLFILFPIYFFSLLRRFAAKLIGLQSTRPSRLPFARHAFWLIHLLPSWFRELVLLGEPFHRHLEAFFSISLSAFLLFVIFFQPLVFSSILQLIFSFFQPLVFSFILIL